ncbi:MAG: hypothetical protein ACLPX1_02620, partial [Steroidobacteraceae bacterium]
RDLLPRYADYSSHVCLGSCVTSIAGPNGMRNYTRDRAGSFGFGNQVLISSHRKLLRSKAVVVSAAETPEVSKAD